MRELELQHFPQNVEIWLCPDRLPLKGRGENNNLQLIQLDEQEFFHLNDPGVTHQDLEGP